MANVWLKQDRISPAAPAPTSAADSVKAATLTMAPLPGVARMFFAGTRKLVNLVRGPEEARNWWG